MERAAAINYFSDLRRYKSLQWTPISNYLLLFYVSNETIKHTLIVVNTT